jgi:hypothetical protein
LRRKTTFFVVFPGASVCFVVGSPIRVSSMAARK